MSSRESRCAAAVYLVFVDILSASLIANTSKEGRYLFVGGCGEASWKDQDQVRPRSNNDDV